MLYTQCFNCTPSEFVSPLIGYFFKHLTFACSSGDCRVAAIEALSLYFSTLLGGTRHSCLGIRPISKPSAGEERLPLVLLELDLITTNTLSTVEKLPRFEVGICLRTNLFLSNH